MHEPPCRAARAALSRRGAHQAALSQAAVSNALLIFGMLTPKLGLTPFFAAATFTGAFTAAVLFWATSVARSHDPNSRERATEKNRNT